MLRRATLLLPVLLAALLASALTAPAASAMVTISGTSVDKRFGKVILRFTTDPGLVRLTLSEMLSKTTASKDFEVECRTAGRYEDVLTFRLLGNGMRRLGGPADVPLKADRCLIRRWSWETQLDPRDPAKSVVVARMTMRRLTSDKD